MPLLGEPRQQAFFILIENNNPGFFTRREKNKKKTLLAQLVERWFPKSDVVGSNPTGRELGAGKNQCRS